MNRNVGNSSNNQLTHYYINTHYVNIKNNCILDGNNMSNINNTTYSKL